MWRQWIGLKANAISLPFALFVCVCEWVLLVFDDETNLFRKLSCKSIIQFLCQYNFRFVYVSDLFFCLKNSSYSLHCKMMFVTGSTRSCSEALIAMGSIMYLICPFQEMPRVVSCRLLTQNTFLACHREYWICDRNNSNSHCIFIRILDVKCDMLFSFYSHFSFSLSLLHVRLSFLSVSVTVCIL